MRWKDWVIIVLCAASGIVRGGALFAQPATTYELPQPNMEEVYPQEFQVDEEILPPLEDELWLHGGSYMYEPQGDHLGWPSSESIDLQWARAPPDARDSHFDLLRLPEWWPKPRPLEVFAEFLGADPILPTPRLHWHGPRGYVWEPRLVGYGFYQLFAAAIERDRQRSDLVGHQAVIDLDMRLTGTERFHVQFRPLGRRDTGGSYYQFNDPQGYIDNSMGEPERYWFEAELHSLVGADHDPMAALDYSLTAGRIPLAMHNFLLMNDEVLAVVANKNTIYLWNLSNLNVQLIYAFDDVSTYVGSQGRMYGVNVSADYRGAFFESTYAFVEHEWDDSRNAHYAALSGTKMLGPTTIAGRMLFKWGDRGGRGDGQLYVLESNRTRVFDGRPLGIEKGVFYGNAFWANNGWNAIGNSNFNRLTAAFEVDPLVRISADRNPVETAGVAAGVQLFRHFEDESFIPEVAFEDRAGTPVGGVGLRYLRKLTSRTYIEALGVVNRSRDTQYNRQGVNVSYFIVF